ncbi:MAG: MarR family transcriptional regulator [Rubrobacter sp.]|nr:MarR family transcriptional regulator [Rubrobacter sp.]
MRDFSPKLITELLRRMSATSTRHVAMLAQKMNLSPIEVTAMQHLQNTGGLTSGQLAERLFLTSGAITGLADRLEDAGYLERVLNPDDRRSRLLLLTSEGIQEIMRHLGPFIEEMEQAIAGLSPEERESIGRFLETVIVTMDPLEAKATEWLLK